MSKPMKVQSLIFWKGKFHTRKSVKNWILKNGYKLLKKDNAIHQTEENTWRVRQKHPRYFDKSTFRTIYFNKYIKAVIGKLK